MPFKQPQNTLPDSTFGEVRTSELTLRSVDLEVGLRRINGRDFVLAEK
jgi:hypothetical protein